MQQVVPTGAISVPLRDRHGEVVAVALLDAGDAHLTQRRWSLSTSGYVVRTEQIQPRPHRRFRTVFLHREVLGLAPDDEREGDHINRDRLDCRRSNLRVATHAENQQNVGSPLGSASQHRGVVWCARKRKWKARARLDGRDFHLGVFANEEEAAAVVAAWRAEHMPFAVEPTA